jgi:hypothetical protein
MNKSGSSAGARNFLTSLTVTQVRFDGITAHVLAAIPTELSRRLGWSSATHAVFYGDNIQRMIVVIMGGKQLCNERR